MVSEPERCRPWIEGALAYSGGTHDFDDIAAGIETGRFQLWPAPDGCLVTEIINYPKKRVLNVFLAGGKMAQIIDMNDAVCAWGKAHGCDTITINGRPGWAKVAAPFGWKPIFTALEKDL